MTDLSPRGKDLLAQFRRADRLDPGAPERHERMARGLFDKLARGEAALPGIDASPPSLPEGSWVAKILGSTTAKLSAGLVVVAAGVTTVVMRTEPQPQRDSKPLSPVVSEPAPVRAPDHPTPAAPVFEPAPAAPVVEPAPAERPQPDASARKPPRARAATRARTAAPAPPIAAPPQVEEPRPIEEAPPPIESTPAPPEPASPSPHRVTSPLDSELGLLRRAYLELNASRPARALEALDEHAYRFPKGELEEAREVARMLALCGLDREPEARALGQKFLKAHPGSPFSGRVRALCPVSLPKTGP